jgi:hypothetical protein
VQADHSTIVALVSWMKGKIPLFRFALLVREEEGVEEVDMAVPESSGLGTQVAEEPPRA